MLAYFFFKTSGQRCFDQPLANLSTAGGQRLDVFDIECIQRRTDSPGQVVFSEEIAKRLRGGRKATRHPDTQV